MDMRRVRYPGVLLLLIALCFPLNAQKRGLESIRREDLSAHMKFLASDELEGRDTGAPGLYVAARYLASQAERLGLEPAGPGGDYFQQYLIHERSIDTERSQATITAGDSSVVNGEPFYMFPSPRADRTVIEGGVVFAGYGIRSEEEGYDDFEGLDIKDKIVLIMSRAPMNEEGNETTVGGDAYSGMMSFRRKIPAIFAKEPKAVLLVFDPKSGVRSLRDLSSMMADYLSRSRSLEPAEQPGGDTGDRPRLLIIDRSLADQLLRVAGKDLEQVQQEIDRARAPHSFILEGIALKMELAMADTGVEVPNVFGMIRGSDPDLSDEMILYLAHFDHVGEDGNGGIFNGADDNASGTAGLVEIAEAFMNEKKPPRRSVGFLWVSAEEIGLFGSGYFADNPLVPIDRIATVINLDMIGRTKNRDDEQSDRRGLTITGKDTVKVIGGLQSSLVMEMNEESLRETGLVGEYRYNDLTHPDRYFYRSDHINFARKDIPVLFYSTGTHKDYHTVNDTEDRIDYDTFLKMVRLSYNTGWKLAGYRGPITVDNPMSGWAAQSSSR